MSRLMSLCLCIALAVFPSLEPAEGAQFTPVLSITFEGNRAIDSARLKSQLRLIREGGPYQRETLEFDLRNLGNFCRDEGYLHAAIGEPKIAMQDLPTNGSGVAIRIPISEGPLFTVGQIALKNVRAFNTATLLQMSPLRTGQSYNRRKVTEWQEKISEGYQTMGYVRLEVNVSEQLHEGTHVVDLTLDLKEGNPYHVAKISVVGDVNASDFKRRLLLGEGGLFNPEMIPLSLQFINRMGLYKPVSQADVEVKFDDSSSTVEIIFHVLASRRSSGSGL